MKIKTYDLVLDISSKRSHLQVRESFDYESESLVSPGMIADFMRKVFQLHQMADEYVYMLAFNVKMRPIGVFEISHGTGEASLLDPRGIFMRALYLGASRIVLVHNHPSGDITPSEQDIKSSNEIEESGKLLHVPLADHIIIGGSDMFSFKQSGLLSS